MEEQNHNQTTFLEEELDQTELPEQEDLRAQAQSLGLEPFDALARELAYKSLTTALPSFWRPLRTSSQQVFYINTAELYGQREHPVDTMVIKEYFIRSGKQPPKEARIPIDQISRKIRTLMGIPAEQQFGSLSQIREATNQSKGSSPSKSESKPEVQLDLESAKLLMKEMLLQQIQQKLSSALAEKESQLWLKVNSTAKELKMQADIELSKAKPPSTKNYLQQKSMLLSKIKQKRPLVDQAQVQSQAVRRMGLQLEQYRQRGRQLIQARKEGILGQISTRVQGMWQKRKRLVGQRISEKVRPVIAAQIAAIRGQTKRTLIFRKQQLMTELLPLKREVPPVHKLQLDFQLRQSVMNEIPLKQLKEAVARMDNLVDLKLGIRWLQNQNFEGRIRRNSVGRRSGERVVVPERVGQTFRERSQGRLRGQPMQRSLSGSTVVKKLMCIR